MKRFSIDSMTIPIMLLNKILRNSLTSKRT